MVSNPVTSLNVMTWKKSKERPKLLNAAWSSEYNVVSA